MNMDEAYRLGTGALSLRPYTPDDAERVHEAVRESMAELSKWMPWAHPDYSIGDTSKWIEHCGEAWAEGTEYNFAIIDAKDGAFLGGCGLNKVSREERRANLGYWVRKGRTGQGVGTEAALLVARFGFEELGLERIEIGAATQNRASQRVAEKLGAVRDRTQEKWVAVGDRIYDAVIFTLTRQALDKPDPDRRTDTQGSSQ